MTVDTLETLEHRFEPTTMSAHMKFTDLLAVLWRRRALISVATLVAVVIGAAVTFASGEKFQSTSAVLLSQSTSLAPGSEALATQEKLNLYVSTYAQIVSSSGFVDLALRKAGIPLTPAVSVAASNPIYASVIDVTVTAPNAERAMAVDQALDNEISSSISLSQASTPSSQRVVTSQIQPPSAHRSSLSHLYVVLIALLIGLALAVTLALLLERP